MDIIQALTQELQVEKWQVSRCETDRRGKYHSFYFKI